jgi:hypothetical protein
VSEPWLKRLRQHRRHDLPAAAWSSLVGLKKELAREATPASPAHTRFASLARITSARFGGVTGEAHGVAGVDIDGVAGRLRRHEKTVAWRARMLESIVRELMDASHGGAAIG